jgi:aminoglycoside phosphotransferase (APT) family kinase protein
MSTAEAPPGLDLDVLGAWFAAEIPGAGDRLRATLIAGGKSNLNYVVTDGAREWIVRRPLGHVLATAHDMAREYRVMSALQDTGVPVPRTYAMCTDPTVLGAEFYVVERCAGTPYRRAELEPLGPERTRPICETVRGHPRHAAQCQSGVRWTRRLRWAGRVPGAPDASLEQAARRVVLPRPACRRGTPSAVVRESSYWVARWNRAWDFRLDNVLVDDADQVTTVLDWEMATLGDPLTDLAPCSSTPATEPGEAAL